jgi:hypothetical protein
MKTMSPVCNERSGWPKLIARMVGRNDVGDESSRSLTLSEAVDEQHVKCGFMLTQPSQETQDNTDADEPPFVAVMKQC